MIEARYLSKQTGRWIYKKYKTRKSFLRAKMALRKRNLYLFNYKTYY